MFKPLLDIHTEFFRLFLPNLLAFMSFHMINLNMWILVSQVACSNWKRIMIILSESLLRDGVPQRDPLAIPRDLVHNSSMHFTFNKFWKRYGKFAKHLMKVCSDVAHYMFLMMVGKCSE